MVLAALPIDRVEPTPYQRDPSEPHVKRLMDVIETLGRFLDPIIAVRQRRRLLDAERQPPPAGDAEARREVDRRARRARSRRRVQDPRAQHREGAQPEGEVARNDPHAARARRTSEPTRTEREFAFEFEQPAFLTLGAAYEERPRLSGGAYNRCCAAIDDFLDEPLPQALKERDAVAAG